MGWSDEEGDTLLDHDRQRVFRRQHSSLPRSDRQVLEWLGGAQEVSRRPTRYQQYRHRIPQNSVHRESNLACLRHQDQRTGTRILFHAIRTMPKRRKHNQRRRKKKVKLRLLGILIPSPTMPLSPKRSFCSLSTFMNVSLSYKCWIRWGHPTQTPFLRWILSIIDSQRVTTVKTKLPSRNTRVVVRESGKERINRRLCVVKLGVEGDHFGGGLSVGDLE